MLNYTQEEVRAIAAELLQERDIHTTPIGNHQLNRNLVYKVTKGEGRPMALKLYYKKNRWNREVATLSRIRELEVTVPELLGYGVLKDGVEWCLMTHLEGKPLIEVFDEISEDDRKVLMRLLGRQLGALHSLSFPYFGNWDKNGVSLDRGVRYSDILIEKIESNMLTLFQQRLPHQQLCKRSLEKLRGYYDVFDEVDTASLCHNDIDSRNILVRKENEQWSLAIIDFEQSYPWDREHDLKNLYHTIFLDNKPLEEEFLNTYSQYHSLSKHFKVKMQAYLLYLGLNICSWSYLQAPEYYRQGVELLERLEKNRE